MRLHSIKKHHSVCVSACSEKNDCAAARWASLLRCRRYQAVVHQLRQELKASQAERGSLGHELEGAVLKASRIECREQMTGNRSACALHCCRHFSA